MSLDSMNPSASAASIYEATFSKTSVLQQQDTSQKRVYDCKHLINKKQNEANESKNALRTELLKSGGGVLLTENRERIVKLLPLLLQTELQEGSLTAIQVLEAFQAKALHTNESTNAITEMIPHARSLATQLDALPKEKRGPLHGIPISVKDNFDVKGIDTTLGVVKRLNKPADENSVLVEVMVQQGAVPFCKTNVPQVLLSYGCSNPIWGETNHPHNITRSSGGSSGGEGALIGGGGSILGLGSDVGGSARVPALFCGCIGFKPTFSRLSGVGVHSCTPVRVGVLSVPGIMGRDVSIVASAVKALLNTDKMFSMDSAVPPLPWRNDIYNPSIPRPLITKKLTIGWYDQFDYIPATPCARRAVVEARDALIAAGHTLVPFTPPSIELAFKLLTTIYNSDDFRYLFHELEGEISDRSIETNTKIMSMHWSLKAMLKPFLSWKMPITSNIITNGSTNSYELLQTLAKRKEYISTFISKWKNENIDVLLGPSFVSTAPGHIYPTKMLPCGIYSILYNFCDFPAGVVPVTKQCKEDLELLKDYEANEPFQKAMKETTLNGGEGLPMGVQIVGQPWQEELVLYAMKEVENCF